MTEYRDTLAALSLLKDRGKFERLCTAVLREAEPLYKSIIHTGVNAKGDTIKSPVDGISFVPNASPSHMISVHHTSGDKNQLRKKLLHDPKKVVAKKQNAQKTPLGDVLKTIELYNKERERRAALVGTLVLTFSVDPDQEVVREVDHIANLAGIKIDWWPASKIAHFLDTDPDGQYLRKQFFGIGQERLSAQSLRDLSRESLSTNTLPDEQSMWIDREIDNVLESSGGVGVSILASDSGTGKTVACYKYLKKYIENGGSGLIISHTIVAQSSSIEIAITKTLQALSPSLSDTCGNDAVSFVSSSEPLLIIVEDINKSGMAPALLEKVAMWHKAINEAATAVSWKLLCPTWKEHLIAMNEQVIKKVAVLVLTVDKFSDGEALNAVKRRWACLSDLEAEQVAKSLGNDPLLIALFDPREKKALSEVIKGFIYRKLNQLSNEKKTYTAQEYLNAVYEFQMAMINRKVLEPTWFDISGSKFCSETLSMLRDIAHQGQVFGLSGDIDNQKIEYRHDRVRDSLLAQAIGKELISGALSKNTLSNPFYARIIGLSLNNDKIPKEIISNIKEKNPLALFYALKELSLCNKETQQEILSVTESWLREENTHSKSNEYLRWECVKCLSQIDADYVSKFLDYFKDKIWAVYEAGFRNGNLGMGAYLCHRFGPGVNAVWHERQIAYVISKYENTLVSSVINALGKDKCDITTRSGILRLCGYIADTGLYEAVKNSWDKESEEGRLSLLGDYFWACAHCCGGDAPELLDPILDVWANMPTEREGGKPAKIDDFAAHYIKWAFKKYVPVNAIKYLVDQTKRAILEWPITYLLNGIDHPDAVVHVAKYYARRKKEGANVFLEMTVMNQWKRPWGDSDIKMSDESRKVLFPLWSDSLQDEHLRTTAYLFWAVTSENKDLEEMRKYQHDYVIGDSILKTRIALNDEAVIPLLIEKIKKDKLWWHHARDIWSGELSDLLEEEISEIASNSPHEWGLLKSDNAYMASELLIRMPDKRRAETLLLTHWNNLKYSKLFIQAALYISTEKLRDCVAEAMSECPDPKTMLQHICSGFGVRQTGHPGIVSVRQLESLVPYIDYVEEADLSNFWSLCNEKGWFDFRRKYLDARAASCGYGRCSEYLVIDDAKKALDTMIEDDNGTWIDYWIEGYQETGSTESEILGVIFEWIRSQNTAGAKHVQLALRAISQIGSREAFLEFKNEFSRLYADHSSLFENAFYLVQRKYLL